VEGGGAGGAGEEILERVVLPEVSQERGGLGSVPIKEGRLPDHGGEAGEFGVAPTHRLRDGFVNDGLEDGRSDGGAHGVEGRRFRV
jgi:hypothetical protein